jgi:serine O-acetyltransferase
MDTYEPPFGATERRPAPPRTAAYTGALPKHRIMFARIREDIAAIRERDPAARSSWEVLTCYPGLHALLVHRMAHSCWTRGLRWPGRFLSHIGRFFTGIEIHPGAVIGRRVFIDHGMGVVVGETAEIGDDCTIYQGVTLGGTSLAKGAKRHPTLARGVIVGANAQVLGGFTVGEGARVGSGAVVVKPVPPGATAVGNPARILQAEADAAREAAAAKMGFSAYGVTQGDDPVAQAMKGLIDNASGHEHQIALLWQAIEKLSNRTRELPSDECVPQDAQTSEHFDADALNRLVK